MTTIGLKLTPLDVLFFRDARPFGQADSASSGLPTPQSFYGLVKTHLALTYNVLFNRLHGLRKTNQDNRWISEIKTRGVWLFREENVFVPVPANLVQLGKTGGMYRLLQPLQEYNLPGWDDPELHPLWFPIDVGDESPRAVSGFLNRAVLQKYLSGEKQWAESDITKSDCLYAFESRTGIGIVPATRIAADSQIYSATFLRLHEGVSFYGEIEVDERFESKLVDAFENPLALPWGGESRRVLIERCSVYDWPKPAKLEQGRLVSLLITPGIFGSRDGRNQNGNGSNPQPSWRPGGHGTLKAAAVGKPQPISGWNLSGKDAPDDAIEEVGQVGNLSRSTSHEVGQVGNLSYESGRPKPTRYAAPAGSVYFWQIGKNNRSVKEGKQLQSIEPLCPKPLESDAGWGLSLTGAWNYFDIESSS